MKKGPKDFLKKNRVNIDFLQLSIYSCLLRITRGFIMWLWKLFSRVQVLQPHGLYTPWSSPGQNTGVGSPSLLQGIFPTQGLNPGGLQVDSLPAEPQEKPKNTGVGSLSLL